MAKKSNYQSGKLWGIRTIKKAFREDGDVGLHRCDKAAETCRKYATDMKIRKTKTGRPLTKPMRDYYRGIADGFLDGYNDL